MADVVAVLVVPAEGDPGGLLREGSCGPIPAMVANYGSWGLAGQGPRDWYITSTVWVGAVALPLWWDGALVPEGWDRARRVADDRFYSEMCDPDVDCAIEYAEFVAAKTGGRVVRLARVDGRLVEVEP